MNTKTWILTAVLILIMGVTPVCAQDDHVTFMLDTFNDERRAFQFRVNPQTVIFVGYSDRLRDSAPLRADVGDLAVSRQVEAVHLASVFGHERIVSDPRHRLAAPLHRA